MFTSLLIYAFVSSFTPGPNNIMALVFANTYGFKRTICFCFGVSVGFFILLLLSSFFNVLLHNFIPKIETFMAIIGAAYLLYLAFIIVKSTGIKEDASGGKYNGFIAGTLLQFVNPKGILYAVTAIGTFVLPYYSTYTALFLFSILLAFIGLLSSMSWSLFGSLFKKVITRYELQFNVIMALLLVYSAITILV